jgi:hypothetical protein
LIGLQKGFLSWPDWGNSDNPYALRHAGVHLDLSAVGNCAKVGTAVLDKELVVLYLKDLPLVEARTDIAREIRLQNILQKFVLAHFNSSEWDKIYPLNTFGFFDAFTEFDSGAGRDFAEIMGRCPCHEELNFAYLEVGVLFKDASA